MYPVETGKLSKWSRCGVMGLTVMLGMGGGGNQTLANELGHPIYRDFPPGKNHIAHLCQAVTQDAEGFIFIANATALRFYDGGTWSLVPLPDESAGIRKFAVTASGTIYAGGAGVIGWIRSSGGEKEFVSLTAHLPSGDPDFEDIYDVLAVSEDVYFSTENHILIWRDGRMRVVPFSTPLHSRGARFHRVGNEVYVSALDHPLGRMAEDRVEMVTDDPVLKDNVIVMVERGKEGALEFLTAEQGFFRMNSGQIIPLDIEANRWLEGRRIICAQRLVDDSLVVAFSAPTGDGGMRFDARGHYLGPIDNSLGLYVKTVRAFFTDREGGLWLGTETGLFRLEWPSAATLFDGDNGLGQGEVVATVRHEGGVYAATTEGVYRLSPINEVGHVARFDRLISTPTYSMTSHPGGLLTVGYEAIHVFESGEFRPIAKLPPGGGQLTHSGFDPGRVWVTTTKGISSLRHTPEGWIDEGLLPGFDQSVSSLEEASNGSLIIVTTGKQRYRVGFTDGADRPGHFSSDGKAQNSTPVLAEGEAAGGGHWVVREDGIEYVTADGSGSRRLPHLIGASTGAVTSLREENDPDEIVLWISGKKGLVRLEVARAFPPPVPLVLQLYAQDVKNGERLSPNPSPLKFEFLALRHQFANIVEYQTRLIGFDSSWTSWSPERERTYANLPAGNYNFEVRARDADGIITAPATLGFVVRPEWWATWWAIVGYSLLSLGVIAGVVQIRTRVLRQHNQQLEAIVAERTHQLQKHSDELDQQNHELVRLNQLELDAKIAARLAEEKSRLEVLRYQLNPHFLFNTLASISASLPSGNSTARGMLERLAEFCRLTLHRADDREWTALRSEIQLLRTYLEIEQSRWGDLLDVEISVDPVLSEINLPHFLLLPLLENALKYGRATSVDRVGIRVTARRDSDGAAVLEVANTGVWMEPQGSKSTPSLGIGLENLRERLARYYPQAHRLEIVSADGWVVVTLRIKGLAKTN
jgi:signal transduction histidine kinase